MKQLLKDITTCKDGESFDVVRVSMTIITFILPFVMLWGIVMETIGFFIGKVFDMPGAFNAVLEFCAAAGAFLMSGSASLYFKKTTEPNGEVSEEENITKGKQPNVTTKDTVIVQP
jgi:hypothetical protein